MIAPAIRPAGPTLHGQLRDWFAEYDALGSRHGDRAQEDLDRSVAAHDALLQRLLLIPSTDPRDALAKYMCESRDGFFEIGDGTHAELRRFSEIVGPLPDDPARTELAALLREWSGLRESCEGLSEDEITAVTERMEETEAQMMGIPSPDLAAFSMKLLVATHFGQAELSDATKKALLAEASRWAGIDIGMAHAPAQSELSYCLDRWVALNARAATQDLTEAESDEIRNLEHRMVPLQPRTVREAYGKAAVWRGVLPYGVNGGEHGALDKVMPAEIARMVGIPSAGDAEAVAQAAAPAEDLPPIQRLLREHYTTRRAASAYVVRPGLNEDDELERLFYRRTDAIETELEKRPSVTGADFAAKALVAHCYGEHSCLDVANDPFWQEARRLTGCPGVPWEDAWDLAVNLAGGPEPDGDEEILRLFHERRAILTALPNHPIDTDEEHERLFYGPADALRDRMMAIPAKTSAGFAAKLIADTSEGGLFTSWETGELWREARRLTGTLDPELDGEASPARDTEVMRLFREWDGVMARYVAEEDDELSAPILDESFKLIDAMVASPSVSGADLAAKVTAVTNWSDRTSLDGPWGDAIMADAGATMRSRGFSYRD